MMPVPVFKAAAEAALGRRLLYDWVDFDCDLDTIRAEITGNPRPTIEELHQKAYGPEREAEIASTLSQMAQRLS